MTTHKIQRLSIDANHHSGLSSYERNRVMIMGAHLESLFFAEGFEDISIPNCNFIHVILIKSSVLNGKNLPYTEYNGMSVIIYIYFDSNSLFEKDEHSIDVLNNAVYEGLYHCFTKYDLNSIILVKMYENIVLKKLFIPFTETYFNKKNRLKIAFKTKWAYDLTFYNIEIHKNGKLINDLHILKTSPIFIPAENPGIPDDQFVRFPTVVGWIDDKTFRITCGHKEYNFLLDEMRVHVIDHEELKAKYVNWQSIH